MRERRDERIIRESHAGDLRRDDDDTDTDTACASGPARDDDDDTAQQEACRAITETQRHRPLHELRVQDGARRVQAQVEKDWGHDLQQDQTGGQKDQEDELL